MPLISLINFKMHISLFFVAFWAIIRTGHCGGPFFMAVNDTEHIIGNDIWNITIGYTYGTKLYYKNHDCVGNAVGHYVSYSTKLPDI